MEPGVSADGAPRDEGSRIPSQPHDSSGRGGAPLGFAVCHERSLGGMAETSQPAPPGGVDGEPPRGGRRLWPRLVVAVAVVAIAGMVWLLFGGERAQQSSEDEARQRLGSMPSPVIAGTTLAGDRLAGPPRAGLYRYRGTGVENTSFPPLTEGQGPQMPATVTIRADGCWAFRVDLNTHHWQEWIYCTADGELREVSTTVNAKRSFGGLNVENTSTFACDPPALLVALGDPPGASRPRSCVGKGSMVPDETPARGPATVIGYETAQVGGQAAKVIHLRYELAYSGGQKGAGTTDLLVLASTGLPVHSTSHLKIDTATPIGNVTYAEDSEFTIETLDPV